MEQKMIKLYTNRAPVSLRVYPGHFATSHSHINYYIDVTTRKTRQSEAAEVAKHLVTLYHASTVVDTIVCVDGTEVIGAYLAEELSRAGFSSINAHQTIYVITPELVGGQMIFRDNLQPMLAGKHVLLLMATVTTGKTVARARECVEYYGGIVQGAAAVFSAVKEAENLEINALFRMEDIPDYQTFEHRDCPYCKAGEKLEAIVNSYGYSKL